MNERADGAVHDTRPELDIVRFADLTATDATCLRIDTTLAQVRSLMAHPYATGSDPAALTLRREGRVVSRIGLFPGQIQIGLERFPLFLGTGWGFDGDPRNRSAAGLLLLRAIREAQSFAGFGISEVAFPIYRAAGFDLVTIPRYILLARSLPVVERHVSQHAIARGVSIPIDFALAAGRRLLTHRSLRARREFRVERIERFDADVSAIDAASRGSLHFPRQAEELNWVLAHPWHSQEARYEYQASYVRDRSGRVVGYGLGRVRFFPVAAGYQNLMLGSILRFAVRPSARGAADMLLASMTDSLVRSGADAVEICTRDTTLATAAKWLGAVQVGALRAGMKLRGAPARALAAHGGSLASASLDMGEGDMIFG